MVTLREFLQQPVPVNYGNGFNYTCTAPSNDATIIDAGSAEPLATQIKGQEGPMISDDFTFNDLTWHGDHVVKIGYKCKDDHAERAGRRRTRTRSSSTTSIRTAPTPTAVQGVLLQSGRPA